MWETALGPSAYYNNNSLLLLSALAKCFTDITIIQFSQQFRCYNIMFEEAETQEIKQFGQGYRADRRAETEPQSQLDSRTHSFRYEKDL